MKIGQLQFDSNLIQAPLAGYSCEPMRLLAQQWGKPAYCCTEMLSAQHIYSGARQKKRYTYKSPDEGTLCVQLSGHQVDHLQHAVEAVVGWGADLVDLNCGCPMPKIRKKSCGSQLLADAKQLRFLVSAMKNVAAVPVTVKIRVDANSGDHYNRDIADAVEQAGADALVVHGRHWSECYDIACHVEDIAQIKQQVSIPVIANGDVACVQSARHLLEQTQADGLMIARAAVGQPWLFEQIRQGLQGKVFEVPDLKTIGGLYQQHVAGLIELEGEKPALLQSRKLAKYYARGRLSDVQLQDFFRLSTWAELTAAVEQHFTAG